MRALLNIIMTLLAFIVFGQQKESDKQLDEATNLIFTNPEKSARISTRMLQEAKDYPTRITALSKLVNAQMVLGDIGQVIVNCSKGIVMAKENKDTVNQIRFLSMLGNQYQQINMNADAKKNLDEAENLINSAPLPKDLLFIQGNVYNVKGIVFKSELNCEFAIKYFDKALAVYNALPDEEVTLTNRLLIDIQKAHCLESIGKIQEAEQLYTEVLESKNNGLGYNRYFASVGLISIYLKRGELDKAGQLLKTINVNDFIQYDLELTSLYYRSMAEYSYLHKNYQSYLYYFDKYNQTLLNIYKSRDEMIERLVINNTANFIQKTNNNIMWNLVVIVLMIIIFTISSLFFYRFSIKKTVG
ncbi:tetratricopeptide repeat protein [Epilithonimonas mollis]|uniref:Tetratricopeptide repeat protein n=1 Tax=Epilithonimonas mollis TaxID=216903 RepID=A0A1M6UUW0_9FLAO|nr:tetratricopeptide repeat protein [Epilithonimonas mollis]SHK73017.1 hypothetical protein SAMN05444371_3480 [Epilithonimonas mollis]